MNVPLAPLLALVLAGCSAFGSDDTPQAQCERQANNDPAVGEIYSSQPWVDRGKLAVAKKQATLRCLREKGLAPPGGVAPVQAP